MTTISIQAIILLSATAASGISLVVPNDMESNSGDSGATVPFNAAAGGSVRYQQVYDASQFSVFASEGAWITHLVFRVDETFGQGFVSTLPNIRIDLSTTVKAPDGLSTVFAENVGGFDNRTVFSGSLSIRSAGSSSWDIVIPLQTHFLYRPSAGNLLLDVRNFSGGNTSLFDGPSAQGDSVSMVYAYTGNGSGDVNSTTGILNTFGLATLFEYTPVPEPSIVSLFVLGISGLGFCWQRKRRPRRI
jgi:hypothetical protein